MPSTTYIFKCKNIWCRYKSEEVTYTVLRSGAGRSIVIDLLQKIIVDIPVVPEPRKPMELSKGTYKPSEKDREIHHEKLKEYEEKMSLQNVEERKRKREEYSNRYEHLDSDNLINARISPKDKKIAASLPPEERELFETDILSKYYWDEMKYINCPKCGKITLRKKMVHHLFSD